MIRDIPRQVSAAVAGLFGRDDPKAYMQIQRERIERLHNLTHGKNKVLAVASGKGGLAKSTTAVNLTLAFAELGLKVALVDMDLTAPAVRSYLAEYLRESRTPRCSMVDLINGTATPEEVEIHPSYLDETGTPRELNNISLFIPQQGQEMRMRAHERLFSQKLQSIIKTTPLARDFTIIDLPAGIREDVVNTWRIADYGILIFEPGEVPLEIAYGVIKTEELETYRLSLEQKLRFMSDSYRNNFVKAEERRLDLEGKRKTLPEQYSQLEQEYDRTRSQLEEELKELGRVIKRKREPPENKAKARERRPQIKGELSRISQDLEIARKKLEADLYELSHLDISPQELFEEDIYAQLAGFSYNSVRELKQRFYSDLKSVIGDKFRQYELVTGRSFEQDIEPAMAYPGKKVIPIVTRVRPTQEELSTARLTFPRIRSQEAIDGVDTQLIMLPDKTELVEDPQIILYSDEVIRSSKEGLPLIYPTSLSKQKSWTEASRSYREIAWQIAAMEYLGVTG
ncbi:P-loop NTPase [Candidatus Woesearchaeota archaeon]|nr:P-loop NTPase [Candidatus Woesearchaeota archaeon]